MASIRSVAELVPELSTAVLYSRAKALADPIADGNVIAGALRRAGLAADVVDIADLRFLGEAKGFMRFDHAAEVWRPWAAPDSALMYHGALAPANTGQVLDGFNTLGTRLVNGRQAWEFMTDKWEFFGAMRAAAVPTIETRHVQTPGDVLRTFEEFRSQGPGVFKKAVSTEGDDVYIVDTLAEAQRVASKVDELGNHLVGQPFIETAIDPATLEPAILRTIDGDPAGRRIDLRINWARGYGRSVDDGFFAVHTRVSAPGVRVNNVAKGAVARKIEFADLHPADRETLRRAITALPPDADIVGWDLIGQPGHRVIMEANSGPGLPLPEEGFNMVQVLTPYAQLAHEGAVQARTARGLLLPQPVMRPLHA